MGSIYEKLLAPAFFRLDPEHAHELCIAALSAASRLSPACRALAAWTRLPGHCAPVRTFGLDFPNLVGLAAGFDKDGVAWPAAAALGFGHVELGTVTARPQPGNPKPRLFRFPAQKAVINRMGFNNAGAAALAARLARHPPPGRRCVPVGINIGKSRAVEVEQAVSDYLQSFALLAPLADYLVLNVSSPNTPGLRKLQDRERLVELLGAVSSANRALARPVPLLLKIAPDLEFVQIDEVLETIGRFKLDGIVATNTTIARPGPFAAVTESGGLSGAPVARRSTEVIRYVSRATAGRLPIIGVGGITDPVSAGEKLDAGATLVQAYTGMIFSGPFFARDVARALSDRQVR